MSAMEERLKHSSSASRPAGDYGITDQNPREFHQVTHQIIYTK